LLSVEDPGASGFFELLVGDPELEGEELGVAGGCPEEAEEVEVLVLRAARASNG